jgi:LysR family transcriptional regulator for metE and metH
MLERAHLEIVRAVSEEGTVTEAANRLCLSQSALSHSIKKLESYLGAPIWRKEGRNLRFTESGSHLLRLAARLLPQIEYAEQQMRDVALGQRGSLRIGMECHPCYRWLLTVVGPFLTRWPKVDVDVKQRFQFGGMGALFNHEIDLLVTPDPLKTKGLEFVPVFAYEQKLAVSAEHPLAKKAFVTPEEITQEVLITYPVAPDRLDIYSQFLLPKDCRPKRRKEIEATDIMLQMVAAGRGVAALPGWLIRQYQQQLPIVDVRLGESGIHKHIHLGYRQTDTEIDYLKQFVLDAENCPDPS